MKTTLCLAASALLLTISTQAQQAPNFKAPPGYTTKVESVVTRYDFSKFNREVNIPLQPFIWSPSLFPAGAKATDKVKPATKAAASLWNSWETVLPEFGAPSRKEAHAFDGPEGGTILYFEWSTPMPLEARKKLCKILYKADEKPAGKDTNDECMVGDTWIIVWSFKKPLSTIKEAHQKYTFETVSREAQRWMEANPEKAKKFQQNAK
jgi:hypothetical protein